MSPSESTVPAEGDTIQISVTAAPDDGWSYGGTNWITSDPPAGTTGSRIVTLEVEENRSLRSRVNKWYPQGSGRPGHKLTQLGATPSITVSHSNVSFDKYGGQVVIDVTTQTDLQWNTEWHIDGEIRVFNRPEQGVLLVKPSGSSTETGSEILTVQCLKNPKSTDRSFELHIYSTPQQPVNIGGQIRKVIRFTQPAGDPYTRVNPREAFPIYEGETYELRIDSNIPWSMTSLPNWVTASQTSGPADHIFDARVDLTIEPNPGAERTAVLQIGDNDFHTITQEEFHPIRWRNLDPIVYGTPLGEEQLRAVSSEGKTGVWTYTPPLGTVLDVGTHTLAVEFLPDDNSGAVTREVPIEVAPAPLFIAADDLVKAPGEENSEITFSYAGFLNGEGPGDLDVAPTAETNATTESPIGEYPITVLTGSDANYEVTFLNGELQVAEVAPILQFSTSSYPSFKSGLDVSGKWIITNENDGERSARVYDLNSATPAIPKWDLEGTGVLGLTQVAVSGDRAVVFSVHGERGAGFAIHDLASVDPERADLFIPAPQGNSPSGYIELHDNILIYASFTREGSNGAPQRGWIFVYDLDAPDPLVPIIAHEGPTFNEGVWPADNNPTGERRFFGRHFAFREGILYAVAGAPPALYKYQVDLLNKQLVLLDEEVSLQSEFGYGRSWQTTGLTFYGDQLARNIYDNTRISGAIVTAFASGRTLYGYGGGDPTSGIAATDNYLFFEGKYGVTSNTRHNIFYYESDSVSNAPSGTFLPLGIVPIPEDNSDYDFGKYLDADGDILAVGGRELVVYKMAAPGEIRVTDSGNIGLIDDKSKLTWAPADLSSRVLTIENTGTGVLSNISVNVEGDEAGLFQIAFAPNSEIEPGQSATFEILPPQTGGYEEAELVIQSSDRNEKPFRIRLAAGDEKTPHSLDLTDVSDTGVSNTDNITQSTNPVFSGSALPDASIEIVSSLDGVIATTTADANGDWSTATSGLSEGVHSITAKDEEDRTSSPLVVTIDNTPPILTISKAPGQPDPATTAPVEFRVASNEPIVGLEDGDILEAGTLPFAASLSGSGPYTVSVTPQGSEGSVGVSLARGAATDLAGNSSAPAESLDLIQVDSFGNEPSTAAALSFSPNGVGGSQAYEQGWLDPSDTDVFSFTLEERSLVAISVSGDVEPVALLYPDPDKSFSPLKSVGAESLPLYRSLEAGTYFLELTSEGGDNGEGVYALTLEVSIPGLVINEVDADSLSSNRMDFVELYDGGEGNTALDDYVLVLYAGSTDTSYRTIDLTGQSTNTQGYFVVGTDLVANVDLILPYHFLHDGAAAVALFEADADTFPNGSAITTTDLVDALVYDSNQPDDPELIALLNPGQEQFNEVLGGDLSWPSRPLSNTFSSQRFPNGFGGGRNTDQFIAKAPTPGAENDPSTVSELKLWAPHDTGLSNTDGITNETQPRFLITARPGSHVEIRSDLDGLLRAGNIASTSGQALIPTSEDIFLSEGTHTITATADGGPSSEPLVITVDTTPPDAPSIPDMTEETDTGLSNTDNVTSEINPVFTGTSSGAATIQFDPIDQIGSLDVIENAGTPSESWTMRVFLGTAGDWPVQARAVDLAGNVSDPSPTLDVTIDEYGSRLTLEKADTQDDPAPAGPVEFVATFEEPVFGFDETDVNTSGSAAGAVSFSGGPEVFTITVEATRAEGSILVSIPAGVATDLAGNPTEPATSTDNRVDLDRDDASGGTPTAVPLISGIGAVSAFLSSNETDRYTFRVFSPSVVTVNTIGNLDTVGEVRNTLDTVLNDSDADDDSGIDQNFQSVLVLPSGTYTVIVSANSGEGDYTLEVDVEVIPPLIVPENDPVAKAALSRKIKKAKSKMKKAKKAGKVKKAAALRKKLKKFQKRFRSL